MMTPEFDDPADYHLRLMIDQMERDDSSEAAIERAVRIASSSQPPVEMTAAHDDHSRDRGGRQRGILEKGGRARFG
jgi:hypothetical protein